MSETIVIGVGNILFRDEGVGVYAARYLSDNLSTTPEVEIIDGASLGFTLMRYFQEYKRVILIDTVSINDTPGSVYRLPAQEMMGLGSYRQTAHEVEIVEMLEICSLLDKMADVTIIGIIPEDIESVEIGLTKSLEDSFENLIDTLIEEIKSCGYQVELKESRVSLKEIIANITSS